MQQKGHGMGLAELLGNMPTLGLLLCTQLSGTTATSFVEQSENSLKLLLLQTVSPNDDH